MRKINRASVEIPSVFHSDAIRTAKQRIAEHLSLPEEVRHKRRAPRDFHINTGEVRSVLYKLFHGKCAYCETPLNTSDGTVDFFRPTGNAANLKRHDGSPDHYVWFMYEWENLFLSCPSCNQSKSNLFPVKGPRAQLRCSWSEANRQENKLLVNPCEDDPWQYLRFDANGVCHASTAVGRATIEVFDLNRPQLIEARSEVTRSCLTFLSKARQRSNSALEALENTLRPQAPYSGVTDIFLRQIHRSIAKQLKIAAPRGALKIRDLEQLLFSVPEDAWQKVQSELTQIDSDGAYRSIETEDRFPFSIASRSFRQLKRRSAISRMRRVTIANFKGLAHLEIEFPRGTDLSKEAPCLMLLGENSTGKSTVLQAISLALVGDSLRKRLRINPEDFLPREFGNWQIQEDRPAEVGVQFDDGSTVHLTIDPLRKKFEGSERPSTVVLGYGSRRFFDSNRRTSSSALGLRTLFEPLATIAHPGEWIMRIDGHMFDAVARSLREILILKDEDEIVRDREGHVLVVAHGRKTPLERLSEGYKSLLTMSIDIMREMVEVWGNLEDARGVVLIDEIETHLHPRWKMRVVRALRKALPKVQFIATSHDPLCLRGMLDGEVTVLNRDPDGVIGTLRDLPSVQSLRAEQLLTSDYFGLSSTSDPLFEAKLAHYANLAGIPREQFSDDDQRNFAQLETDITSRMLLGDDPREQIINEALNRYISERQHARAINRAQIKENAVLDVLNAIKQARGW